MRLVLLGAPGSGKGTQGQRLAARSGAEHIATGDLLRAQVQQGTELGKQVAGYLDSGALVPDQVLLELAWPLVRAAARGAGYILDGYPRSVAQAIQFDRLAATEAPIESVFFLRVPRDELVARLLRRAAEQDRSDDTEEVILHRLRVFDSQTSPLVDYYRRAGLLTMIEAGAAADDVAAVLLAALPA